MMKQYLMICDAKARKVMDVEEGRDAQTVIRFSYKLEEKGGNCEKINVYVSDMSLAYEIAKEECFLFHCCFSRTASCKTCKD